MSFEQLRGMGQAGRGIHRAAQGLMVAAMTLAGTSCATVYAPALVPGQVAHVNLVASDPIVDFDGYRPNINVSVHDYANGCPLVESTRTGKGYRGKVEVPPGATTNVAVPAGRRLTFTTAWHVPDSPFIPGVVPLPLGVASLCTSVVTFVPEAGRTYVIRFPAPPDGQKRACGATAEIDGGLQSRQGPTELIAYPHVLRGSEAFQPGGLCALGDK